MGAGRRQGDRENLRNGLTVDERLVLLETAVDGDRYRKGIRDRVETLEHAANQRALGWFGRLMLRLPFGKAAR